MRWVTVAEAMKLAGRGRTQIYDWVAAGRLRTVRTADNTLLIDGLHLLEVQQTVKRGRRPGSARKSS